MEEIKDKSGNVIEYTIGNSISIHRHVSDSEMWFITIRELQIYGERLCPKTYCKEEIARCAHVVLKKIYNRVSKLIEDVVSFT